MEKSKIINQATAVQSTNNSITTFGSLVSNMQNATREAIDIQTQLCEVYSAINNIPLPKHLIDIEPVEVLNDKSFLEVSTVLIEKIRVTHDKILEITCYFKSLL